MGVSVLARITDHFEGLVTSALYGVEVDTVTESTVDDSAVFARKITHFRSYLSACAGVFRTSDVVDLSGRLVHVQGPAARSGFGIELSPWSAAESFLANLTR
ncbi:hypothetical protein [Streptomyces sp. BK340]|uniref:hypothetical protein n=1 Tax=Streptomyces sp. BK340 TaxID=2572903 RepID=UPI0011AE0839|nr:hypothetical protein [Streptomyces sp. BK340]TVZ84863.1 hypothetical protein FB157_120130 [Streptomyces sp. BK340]